MADNKIIWEVSDLGYEVEESNGQKSLKLKGTALTTGVSRNGRKYSVENLQENDQQPFNFIVGHQPDYDNPKHCVGEGIYYHQGEKLKFEGVIKNTKSNPDIVEATIDKRVAVSIQGGYKTIESVGKEVRMKGLRIPILALVNKHTRGVPGAAIEMCAAVEESLQLNEVNKKNQEGETMAEENQVQEMADLKVSEAQLKLQLKEAQDNLAKAESEKTKLQESIETAKKMAVVESILGINKTLKKEELMEKSDIELKLIKEYEQKLAKKPVKENDQSSEEGAGEVPEGNTEEKSDNDGSLMEGVAFDKKTGRIGFTEEGYKAFNKSIRESVYNN
jgi:hypothetical protein